MTRRYPSASTALPTSLAMVFTASKSSLEAAGKPALIMLTLSLASYRAMSSFSLEVREASGIARRRGEWCRRCERSWVRDAIGVVIRVAAGGRYGCGSGV